MKAIDCLDHRLYSGKSKKNYWTSSRICNSYGEHDDVYAGFVERPTHQGDGRSQMDDNTLLARIRAKEAKITILGMGHVGLPTALGLAELGWDVVGADTDTAKINLLKSGQSPFFEHDMQELLSKHLQNGKFRPMEDLEAAIRAATILFVCVGTPQKESGQADLSQVEGVARSIAGNLNGYKLIIEKSTVPAITAQWIKRTIQQYAGFGISASGDPRHGENSQTIQFDVACNPEFLQEGKALQDFFHPERVVCGVESERAREILSNIYKPLNCPMVITDLNTAELIKHAANAFLATKISFTNMVADLCEAVGADITKVASGIGLDSRIGPAFLQAGIGFGGYCLPKDLRAFVYLAAEHNVDFSLLKEAECINRQRIELFLKKIRERLWVLPGKTVGVLGLAFKPDTDDIRETPSLKIVNALRKEGVILKLYDPQAMSNTQQLLPEEADRLTYCASPYDVARGAQALVLLTEWEEFRQLDLPRLRELMDIPVLIDGRNFYDPETVRAAGFEYVSIGR